MEPIKINVEVSLSEATISALRGIAGILSASKIVQAAPEQVESFMTEAMKLKSMPAITEEVTTDSPAEAKPEQTNGQQSTEEATEEVTEEALSTAIKDARRRKVPASSVRAVLTEFNLKCSSDCPAEQRTELYNRIIAL